MEEPVDTGGAGALPAGDSGHRRRISISDRSDAMMDIRIVVESVSEKQGVALRVT